MPHPNHVILGKPRREWVRDAAKAIVAATDPARLWQIVDAGFDAFLPKARKAFGEQEPGIHFTTDEIRWMFTYLAKHIAAEMKRQRREHPGKSQRREQPERDTPTDYTVESQSRLVH